MSKPWYNIEEGVEIISELECRLEEVTEIADNLALLCYASGCGIGTKTMLDYEAMKKRNAPQSGERSE